jgi:triphosphoribosyl-dephospho-CoA synthase
VSHDRHRNALAHDAAVLAENFRWACMLDIAVRKPGNVSRHSPGHGMQAAQFLASAQAAAPLLCAPDLRVGQRIEQSVIATQAAAGCNTNLGILLLCAPIAAAMWRVPASNEAGISAASIKNGADDAAAIAAPCPTTATLRAALKHVLHDLDQDDAAAAFRAIALANPGGLGDSDDQDVRTQPTVSLRAAMAIAATRDRIALQYVTDFDDLFAPALPDFMAGLGKPMSAASLSASVQAVFLGFLARFPDAHIVRKHGPSLAQSVTQQARQWRNAWGHTAANMHDAAHREQALAQWDTQLKAASINPGTSADLTVATLFLAACLNPRLRELSPGDEVAWKMHFR